MNYLLLLSACLVVLSVAEAIKPKQKVKSCMENTDFRKFSHCITKRQTDCASNNCSPCNSRGCNDIPSNSPCGTKCSRDYDYDDDVPISNTNTNTRSNNTNLVNVNTRTSNDNEHKSGVVLTLKNVVNNINKIHNPVTVENSNHFSYNGRLSSITKCQNGTQGMNCQTENLPIVNSNSPRPPCMNRFEGYRPPMILPPFMPPPPSCNYIPQRPFLSCSAARPPVPVVVPNCAACFYCGGQYNPLFCSSQPSCKPECKVMQCQGKPCYPQIQPCSSGLQPVQPLNTELQKLTAN